VDIAAAFKILFEQYSAINEACGHQAVQDGCMLGQTRGKPEEKKLGEKL